MAGLNASRIGGAKSARDCDAATSCRPYTRDQRHRNVHSLQGSQGEQRIRDLQEILVDGVGSPVVDPYVVQQLSGHDEFLKRVRSLVTHRAMCPRGQLPVRQFAAPSPPYLSLCCPDSRLIRTEPGHLQFLSGSGYQVVHLEGAGVRGKDLARQGDDFVPRRFVGDQICGGCDQ